MKVGDFFYKSALQEYRENEQLQEQKNKIKNVSVITGILFSCFEMFTTTNCSVWNQNKTSEGCGLLFIESNNSIYAQNWHKPEKFEIKVL